MLINDQRRTLFLHNPKTAGLSLSAWLLSRWPHEWRYYGDPTQHIICIDRGQEMRVVRRHTWHIPDELRSYQAFCVVREPLERFASWYRFARRHGYAENAQSLAEFALKAPRSLPFQASYVELASTVLRFEELPHCLRCLPWVADEDIAEFPQLNATDASAKDSEWTPEARLTIADVFRRDFEVCGYAFHPETS